MSKPKYKRIQTIGVPALMMKEFFLIGAVFLVPKSVFAEEHFGVWGGGAPSSPHIISQTPDRKIGLLAFQYARDIGRSHFWRWEYTADVIPVLVVSQPREEGSYYFEHSSAERNVHQSAHAIGGAGLYPLGIRLTAFPDRRLCPYAAISAGAALTKEKIPYQVSGGTAANFMFQMGGGVRFAVTRSYDLLLGYAWWHVSNARLTPINPGIDANLFYAGLLF